MTLKYLNFQRVRRRNDVKSDAEILKNDAAGSVGEWR